MKDNNTYWLWAMIFVAVFSVAAGGYTGVKLGEYAATTRLTQEAVREHAGQWVAGGNGEAVFKWRVCIPAGEKK